MDKLFLIIAISWWHARHDVSSIILKGKPNPLVYCDGNLISINSLTMPYLDLGSKNGYFYFTQPGTSLRTTCDSPPCLGFRTLRSDINHQPTTIKGIDYFVASQFCGEGSNYPPNSLFYYISWQNTIYYYERVNTWSAYDEAYGCNTFSDTVYISTGNDNYVIQDDGFPFIFRVDSSVNLQQLFCYTTADNQEIIVSTLNFLSMTDPSRFRTRDGYADSQLMEFNQSPTFLQETSSLLPRRFRNFQYSEKSFSNRGPWVNNLYSDVEGIVLQPEIVDFSYCSLIYNTETEFFCLMDNMTVLCVSKPVVPCLSSQQNGFPKLFNISSCVLSTFIGRLNLSGIEELDITHSCFLPLLILTICPPALGSNDFPDPEIAKLPKKTNQS